MKRRRSGGWQKKISKGIAAVVIGIMLGLCMPVAAGEAQAAETTEVDLAEMFSDVTEQITEALEQIDTQTAEEMFDFVKEKISDGSLKTEEGLAQAIEEGERKFGVVVDKQTAQKVVDTMEKLEEMGFSGEELVDKAKGLYEQYGADFIEHANEAITQAVEEAVTEAVDSFFTNLWEGTKNFFQNLIGGL